jgi:hypothetical protein
MFTGTVPSPETARDMETETIRMHRASCGQSNVNTRKKTRTQIPFRVDDEQRAKMRCMACLLGDKK